MSDPDQTFTISVVEKNRKIRVIYKREGQYHIYSSPDVNGSAYFASDKNKAYLGFIKKLKELI